MGVCTSKPSQTATPRKKEALKEGIQDGKRVENVGSPTGDVVQKAVESDKSSTGDTGQGNENLDVAGSSSNVEGSSTRQRRLSCIPSFRSNDGIETGGEKGKSTVTEVTNDRGEKLIQPTDLDDHSLLHSVVGISSPGMEPGYDKTNQDYIAVNFVRPGPDQNAAMLVSVLDGHGVEGHHVSKLACECIVESVMKGINEKDLAGVLWDSFCDAHNYIVSSSGIDCTFSGATATVSVLSSTKLTSAWVGDSRAVLGRREGDVVRAYDLTTDHKPDLPEERARIERTSGRVEPLLDEYNHPIGPPRVWLADSWMPGLAMSRSLGDTLAASCGVTCCPDVSVVELTPADICIIWASDGVWEFMTSQDAVDIVAECEGASEAAALLVRAAKEHWRINEVSVSDDISCIVALMNRNSGPLVGTAVDVKETPNENPASK